MLLLCPGVLGLLLLPSLSVLGGVEPGLGEQPPEEMWFELSGSLQAAPPRGLQGCVMSSAPGNAAFPEGFAPLGLGFEPCSIPFAAGGAPGAPRALEELSPHKELTLRAPLTWNYLDKIPRSP